MFMKKLLFTLTLFSSLAANAQNCSQIFISEYVEGWSNNKALEIYNPTSNPVDLSQFFVARYSNGATTANTITNSIQLSGTVQPHDVYVAVLDQRDTAGTGQTAPVWDELQVKADGFYSPVYATCDAFYWNGNDAILLGKGTLPASNVTINSTNVPGFQIIDIFGKIGENPGNGSDPLTGWTCTFPYVQSGAGATVDHSMIRKFAIQKGVSSQVSFFDPLLEYDTIPAVIPRTDSLGNILYQNDGVTPQWIGNWNSLGTHDCQCNPASVDEVAKNSFIIYPNPSNGALNIKSDGSIKSIQIINALGQTISTYNNLNNKPLVSFDLTGMSGVYFVKINTVNGGNTLRKVILK